MVECILLIFSFCCLLKYSVIGKVVIVLPCLLLYNAIFFYAVFGGSSWDVIKSSYLFAPFALSLIINSQIILILFFRHKGFHWVFVSLVVPPIFFCFFDFNFIIPSHPLMMLYQFDVIYKFLPRFRINVINVVILYVLPFCILLPIRKCVIIIMFVFLYFFAGWYFVDSQKLGVKVLIVQTGMFLLDHEKIFELKNEIFKYKNADIVIFSESPVIGFKEGTRTAFTHDLIDEIKSMRDDKLYILNNYGFIDSVKYNYNLSLYIMNGRGYFKAKTKLVPFWETPGIFYKSSGWDSLYFSVPAEGHNEKYKFKNISINTYICYEAMFVNHTSDISDLTVIQSNYDSFQKGYDRVVKNGNIMAYVNKSSGFKSFISVQNMGGTIFVDNTGKFHWDIYEKSKSHAVFLLEI